MKKGKRAVSILLCFIMTLMLAGCGGISMETQNTGDSFDVVKIG